MYVIHKNSTISETLVVKGKKGEELVLPVELEIESILSRYNRIRRILGEAQEKLLAFPDSDECKIYYGKAVFELFCVVFGDDGAQKLLDFYSGQYSKMLEDVAPFIVDCIQPQVESAMMARIAKYKAISKKAKNHGRKGFFK